MWLHQFDLLRWIQKDVMQDSTGSQPPYDKEVFNVFTLYLCHSYKQQSVIYVPLLLQKYIRSQTFADKQLEQEMAQESLIFLIRYVCRVLDDINKGPDETFP